MIDYHKTLVNTLKTILPAYYELNLKSGISTPCISYMLRNDYSERQGDSVGYSVVSYQIKVWSEDLADLQNYAIEIDNALRPLGWQRTSTGELYDNESAMKQKILVYEARFHENF